MTRRGSGSDLGHGVGDGASCRRPAEKATPSIAPSRAPAGLRIVATHFHGRLRRKPARALSEHARGSRNDVILVDAQDMIAIFEGRVTLPDALIAKIDSAEQEGRPLAPTRPAIPVDVASTVRSGTV